MSIPTEDPPTLRLVDTETAAALVGVDEQTWLRWWKKGLAPPPVQLGGRIRRWRTSDIEAWIQSLPTATLEEGVQ